jgi:hypothetical protein
VRLFISAPKLRDKLIRATKYTRLLAYTIIILLYKKLLVYSFKASKCYSVYNLLKSNYSALVGVFLRFLAKIERSIMLFYSTICAF